MCLDCVSDRVRRVVEDAPTLVLAERGSASRNVDGLFDASDPKIREVR
jgi:hypothetical protein